MDGVGASDSFVIHSFYAATSKKRHKDNQKKKYIEVFGKSANAKDSYLVYRVTWRGIILPRYAQKNVDMAVKIK